LHIERRDDGSALGYLRVTETREGYGGDRVLALPLGWAEMESSERRFEAAEEVRLLYVAVTRAKEELVVARWPDGRDTSPWRALRPWLDERATLLELESRAPAPRARVEITAGEADRASAEAASSLAAMSVPTFVHTAVTELAKASRSSEPARTSGPAPTSPAHGFRGFSWGSAVHGALAAAAAEPGAEALRATCRDLLVEHERPLDDHGEPVELIELLDLVRTVRASELWRRAQSADRVFSEVSFAVPGVPDDAVEGRGPDAPIRVLEGVIDLAFLEADGWVIADYKTDLGTDPDFANREVAYRRQVDLYAEAWSRLTGDPVKERVLFFTAQGRVERW